MTRQLALYRRLTAYARPYWPHLLLVLGLQFLSTPLTLLGPLPLKIAVDTVLGSRPLPGWLQTMVPGHGPNRRPRCCLSRRRSWS